MEPDAVPGVVLSFIPHVCARGRKHMYAHRNACTDTHMMIRLGVCNKLREFLVRDVVVTRLVNGLGGDTDF